MGWNDMTWLDFCRKRKERISSDHQNERLWKNWQPDSHCSTGISRANPSCPATIFQGIHSWWVRWPPLLIPFISILLLWHWWRPVGIVNASTVLVIIIASQCCRIRRRIQFGQLLVSSIVVFFGPIPNRVSSHTLCRVLFHSSVWGTKDEGVDGEKRKRNKKGSRE